MKEQETFISTEEIQYFYKERCKEIGKAFSEKEFSNFVNFCELDFFDWLDCNWKYFELEED